jgi:membrane-anchored protein YejM (alkaline phosphatase superfamily)
MMQSYNRIILSILWALLILLCVGLSVVYSRSEYPVSPELGGQSHTGDGLLGTTDESKRPYVLLIGIETLRADHVGHLGYSRNTTPALDAIAKEGVVFTKTMATASWTMPAVMSVLTSLYPEVHGTSNYDRKLPESVPTLTEVLQENGYKTVAFVSNPTLDGRYGFCRGFELYDDFSVWLGSIGMGKSLTGSDSDVHKTLTNEPLTRSALSWLERHYEEPFFMFAFYFDPHYDYIPPSPFDTMFDPNYDGTIDGRGIAEEPRKSNRPAERDLEHIIALYDGEVRYTDTYILKLLEAFAEFGILDQTLVVIFGDHGDEFYEHGSTGHAHTLYNELIHIPLILRWPSEIPKGRCIDALVSQVDIMPTILDYLGIQHQQAIQGMSLKNLIEGRVCGVHEYVFAGGSTHRCAIIGSRSKMIVNPDGDKEFYDLLSDPMEQNSIHQTQNSSALAATFERRLEQWALENRKLTALFPRDSDSDRIQLDEHRLKQLRALGYVQ